MTRRSICIALSALVLTACGGGEPVVEIAQPAPVSNPAPSAPSTPSTPSTPSVTGSATLSWVPPSQNEDGSALTNLAGYRIHYGTSASDLAQVIEVSNPGLTRYVVDNLSAGTWYFGIRAYTRAGGESALSVVGSKTIR